MARSDPRHRSEAPTRTEKTVHLLLQLFLVGALVAALVLGALETAYVTALTLAVALAPRLLMRRFGLRVPAAFVIAAVVFIYASLLLGELQNFYERFWWWDGLLHFGSAVGLGIVGFAVLYLFHTARRGALPPSLVALFAFSVAVTIGVGWEVYEFASDQVRGTNMQAGGLTDTMWDLIVDSCGAMLASGAGYVYLKRGEAPIVGEAAETFARENRDLVDDGDAPRS